MKILVTGAKGFVGKNLCINLKNKGYTDVYEYDLDTPEENLELWTKDCDFVLAGITTEQVLQAVDTAVEMVKNGDNGKPVPYYTDENVSVKVVKLIQSYVGVVNKMVWRKF